MKKIIALLLIAVLALTLAACGGTFTNQSDKQTNNASESGKNDSAANDSEIVIGGKTVNLTYESRHGDMYFKENVVDIEKSSFGQACNLYYNSDDGMLFVIHIVYFEGKGIDEVISGSENNLTDKTVGGLEYRYFEYDENGKQNALSVCLKAIVLHR